MNKLNFFKLWSVSSFGLEVRITIWFTPFIISHLNNIIEKFTKIIFFIIEHTLATLTVQSGTIAKHLKTPTNSPDNFFNFHLTECFTFHILFYITIHSQLLGVYTIQKIKEPQNFKYDVMQGSIFHLTLVSFPSNLILSIKNTGGLSGLLLTDIISVKCDKKVICYAHNKEHNKSSCECS